MTRRRAEAIPYGAVVMERLLKAAKLDRVVDLGVRSARGRAVRASLARRSARRIRCLRRARICATRLGATRRWDRALERWTAPLFPGERRGVRSPAPCGVLLCRHRMARASRSSRRADVHRSARTRRSSASITPAARCWRLRCSTAMAARTRSTIKRVAALRRRRCRSAGARCWGCALRAALVIAGPAPELLAETSVKLTPNALVVTIPKAHQALVAEAMTKRLRGACRSPRPHDADRVALRLFVA